LRFSLRFSGEDASDDEQELLSGVKDPFDIISSDDTVDGIPLDEPNFWRKVG
jgi:hypothetical protein